MRNIQLNSHGELQHLLTIEGLRVPCSRRFSTTRAVHQKVAEREVKSAAVARQERLQPVLRELDAHRTPSRPLPSGSRRMFINLNINTSSASKGETLLDTDRQSRGEQADMFVVRHQSSGRALLIARASRRHRPRSHPRRECRRRPPCRIRRRPARHVHDSHYKQDFTQLTVAIIGDILPLAASRVSQIHGA